MHDSAESAACHRIELAGNLVALAAIRFETERLVKFVGLDPSIADSVNEPVR